MPEVRFAGVEFPTLLHAKWALFMDDLFIPWRFRPASFNLEDGRLYQPDFFLPRHRFWFQVGPEMWDDSDLRDWEEFAAAATASLCEAAEEFTLAMKCDMHKSRHTIPLLPPEWQGNEAIYASGPLPAPECMLFSGPSDGREDGEFMRVACDSGYQWCRCPQCGRVGVEHAGRAARLGCGHLDQTRDEKCADDPFVLAAYRMARQAMSSQMTGECARCSIKFVRGDLISAGRHIDRRRWYHAECLLQAHRERNSSASDDSGADKTSQTGDGDASSTKSSRGNAA